MSTAIQRRGRPGLATLIEKFPLILFLALLVWLSVQSPYFLSWQNISLMLVQSVPLAILCFGLVCVIAVGGDDVVSGGIDLSLPATACSASRCSGRRAGRMAHAVSPAAGAAGGGLPAVRGDQRLAGAGGRPAAAAGHPLDLGGVYRPDRSVDRPATHCGQRSAMVPFRDNSVLGLPWPLVYLLGVFILFQFLLHHSRFGQHVQAVGGNRDMAQMSGLNVRRLTCWSGC